MWQIKQTNNKSSKRGNNNSAQISLKSINVKKKHTKDDNNKMLTPRKIALLANIQQNTIQRPQCDVHSLMMHCLKSHDRSYGAKK